MLRKIIEGEPYKFPATIEDESVLATIEEVVKKFGHGLGSKYTLKFRGDIDVLNNEMDDNEGEAVKEVPVVAEKKL